MPTRSITIPTPESPEFTTFLNRFLSHIVEDPDPPHCWLWIGAVNLKGYPLFGMGRSHPILAHRVSHQLFLGPIPPGHQVDHTCRRRNCVWPPHLEAVPARENNRRSSSPSSRNATKTHCLRGHPLSGSNVIVRPTGQRRCRACRREYDAKRARHATR